MPSQDFMKKAITFEDEEIRVLSRRPRVQYVHRRWRHYREGAAVPRPLVQHRLHTRPQRRSSCKYHKWHIPASIGLGTSPHDMFDEYKAVFGADIKNLFPVIDTPIGKLGMHDLSRRLHARSFARAGLQRRRGDLPSGRAAGSRRRLRAVGFLDVHAPHTRPRQHGVSAGLELGHGGLQVLSKRVLSRQLFRASTIPGMVMRHAPYPEEQVLAVDHRHRSAARAPHAMQSQHLGGRAHRGIPARSTRSRSIRRTCSRPAIRRATSRTRCRAPTPRWTRCTSAASSSCRSTSRA